MKINITITLITMVLLAVLASAGFFVYQNMTADSESRAQQPANEENQSTSTAGKEKVLEGTRVVKEDFEITLPTGWQEATNTYEGVLLLALDAKEDVSGGNFQKLDFRTSLTVKSDNMQSYAAVADFEDYISSVKTALIQAIPGINFTKEEQKTINANKAIIIETESTQEEADFKTLLVFIEGGNRAVYALSFNTFQDSWPDYKSLFYRMAESFKLKYKMEL